ncbi:hypothetical protein VTO73DRAFT_3433 [Trametes versicolor]
MEARLNDTSLAASRSERTPLLRRHGEVQDEEDEVTPLRYGRISKAADTLQRAFANDPIMIYYGSADTVPFFHARWKLRHSVTLLDAVHQKRVLTVNQGDAVLEYGIPGNNTPSTGYKLFHELLESFDTPELKRRKAEFRGKVMEFVRDAFGEQVNDMYDLQMLATAPEAQGRGYGSALVNAVTDMADAEGRDTWVITVNASEFYEHLGFQIVREGVLGDDNPSWEGKPVPVFVLRKRASKARVAPRDGMTEKS